MIDPLTTVGLVLLGTWAALDSTSVAQIMVSRPLVIGTLSGLVLGDPATGMLAGALLEGVHLADVPSGGVSLPEPGPATVPAATAAILLEGAGGLALGVSIGALLALAGGRTMHGQRRLNTRILGLDADPAPGPPPRFRHLLCVAADALRGLALTSAGLLAVWLIPANLVGRWPLHLPATVLLLALPGTMAGGVLLRSWSGEGRWTVGLFAVGLLAGFVGGVIL